MADLYGMFELDAPFGGWGEEDGVAALVGGEDVVKSSVASISEAVGELTESGGVGLFRERKRVGILENEPLCTWGGDTDEVLEVEQLVDVDMAGEGPR